jgi:hypothetical protein
MFQNSIVYYSSNTESPEFEEKIIRNIKDQSRGLPIISVTRKPMDFGKNICIGETPICYSNSFKQLLIGLKEAKTEFCIATESDVLYPPEYFNYIPFNNERPYRYDNVWVHFDGRDRFYRKLFSEGAQMCGREHWINSIRNFVVNPDSWEPEPSGVIFPEGLTYSWSGNPVITFKTRKAQNFKTGYQKVSTTFLPYWGEAVDVKKKYL